MINPITGGSSSNQVYTQKEKKINTEEKSTNEIGATLEIKGSNEKRAGYSKPIDKKPNAEEINRLWQETNKATESLKNLVKDLLEKQGLTFKDVLDGKAELVVDDEVRAKAEESISENGEFGVIQVTKRIVDFAKAMANGDKSKISELRSSIEQGFNEVEKILGKLPEISKQTRDSIMTELDKWEKED